MKCGNFMNSLLANLINSKLAKVFVLEVMFK